MNFIEIIEFKLFDTDKFSLTVYQLVVFALILLLTWILLKIVKKLLAKRTKKHKQDYGTIYAVFQILKYFIWIIAIGIALETIGIKFNLLIASSAALLVGIGFGLQQIFMDYLSGILILFEGNLKINDVVQIGELIGRVQFIGLRTTKIQTRDHYVIIVPNHKFINEKLINWSHIETKTRFHVNVGVSYGSDVRLVENILYQCADACEGISAKPSPFVRFNDFGNSSLDFQLFFWTDQSFEVENIKSALRYEIDAKFRENNITIPFPQRDIHIKTQSQ